MSLSWRSHTILTIIVRRAGYTLLLVTMLAPNGHELHSTYAADPRLLLEASRVFNAAVPDHRAADTYRLLHWRLRRRQGRSRVRRAILGMRSRFALPVGTGRLPAGVAPAERYRRHPKKDDPYGRLHPVARAGPGSMYREERAQEISSVPRDTAHRDPQGSCIRLHPKQRAEVRQSTLLATRIRFRDCGESADDFRKVCEEISDFRALVAFSEK